MKKKIISAVTLLTLTGLFLVYGQKDEQSDLNRLIVNVSSSKSTYLLGEPVILDFEIKNLSSADIWLNGKTLKSGYLTISIADSDGIFKRFSAVGDTGDKKSPSLLKKDTTAKSSSRILWNANRAENASNPKLYEETDILTYYAFPTAGSYNIKAILHVSDGQKLKQIESESVQITIEEPTGDDLEVWNIIKDREDIGFFIQEAYVRASQPKKKEKTLRDIEQIINQYPNSLHAELLRQSITKLQASEKIRQKYLEKMQKQKDKNQ